MAIDKDPSIYRDRGTIGSSDELDEYGVWVKSEPQVLKAPSSAATESIEPALPDIEDLPDLDLEFTEDAAVPDIPEIPMEKVDELVPDFSDLPSFTMDEEPAASEDSFTELSIDDFLEPSGTPSEEDLAPETPAEESLEDMDLEFPDESVSEISDGTEELAATETLKLEPVTDFDDFLNDLSDQSAPTPPTISAETLAGMPDIDLDIPDEISVELSASDGVPEIEPDVAAMQESFDDVEALSKDLEDREPRAASGKVDLSTELLMRIAEELSSIKNELSSLKGELSVLRSVAKPEAAAPEPAAEETKEEPASAPRGFFDEEEDETIALTGDELDNILNTADFTEEAGSDAGEDIDLDAEASMDFLGDKPDILSDEEPDAAVPTIDDVVGVGENEPAIESIDINEDGAVEDLPLELAELRESGVRPMTPAPEDTRYLEEEQIDLQLLNPDGDFDLTEAVIEEPDLGDFALEEARIEEPSIESINIDLDLEDKLQAEEIILPIETKEESFEELIPEGFVVDSESESAAASEPEEPEAIDLELEPESAASEDSALQAEGNVPVEPQQPESAALPQNLRQEVRAVLSYMDQLLESLPESKIEEFARSEYFDTYKKLFEELGIA